MKQKKFPFYSKLQKEPLLKHLQDCEGHCKLASVECIHKCAKEGKK